MPRICSAKSALVNADMAVLQHAAHLFAVAYRTGKFDTAVSWSEGDTSESKAQQLLSTMGDAWRDQAVAAMRTYQLTELIV